MKVYKRNYTNRLLKLLLFVYVISMITASFYFIQKLKRPHLPTNIEPNTPVVETELDPTEKIDWHDEEFIRMESERKGNGERGPATFPPDYDKTKCDDSKVFQTIGYNGCLSDFISVNRSILDSRPEGCRNVTYRRHLPKVSVIIPSHNEHWSVLLRAIYSILNRSPAELLEEIILVDDGSTEAQMKQQLDDYVASNLPKVRVLRVPLPRKGLMAARMLGARNATGEILVFLDSNLETNVNWLPPLLEPIVENYRTCVCPVVDFIDVRTFEVNGIGQGVRNVFDWTLTWVTLPLLPEDRQFPTKPFKSPVMVGCAFAISKSYFWELGAYDPELQLWGGEQFELAFKLWLCGGALVDAPCSRVAHLFRANGQPFKAPGNIGDYLGRNLKRIADVWMDEYAEYVYKRMPHYKSIDAGDLSKQRELRQKLKCKPFRWFMEKIAFDIIERYPLIQPPNYGSGKIKPLVDDGLCLTAVESNKTTEIQNCSSTGDKDHRQKFVLSWRKDIRVDGSSYCLDVFRNGAEPPVALYNCHGDLGNQLWKYDMKTQQFRFGKKGDGCLTYNATTKKVFIKKCDETFDAQKWRIDWINEDALRKWNETKPLVGS